MDEKTEPKEVLEETSSTGNSTSVTDYLQAPRKKRKNYVIIALNPEYDRQFTNEIKSYIKKSFSSFALSTPADSAELKRQFSRNISLLIISDNFSDAGNNMLLIKTLKEKRSDEKIPILFLTKNPPKLIEEYNKILLPYHETDNYILCPGVHIHKVFSAIKNSIEHQNSRKSRRYQISIHVGISNFSQEIEFNAEIIDLSLHGALIRTTPDIRFNFGNQLQIKVPTHEHFKSTEGEYIRLSGIVRRVYISGNIAAISFKHLSEGKIGLLSKLLTTIVARGLERRSIGLKASLTPKSVD